MKGRVNAFCFVFFLFFFCNLPNGLSLLSFLTFLTYLALSSFAMASVHNQSSSLLICHWLLIVLSCILLQNEMELQLMDLLLLLLFLDLSSLFFLGFLPSLGGLASSGPWFYLMFQSLITLLTWWAFSSDCLGLVCLCYFLKLGAGPGGYYLPSFYFSFFLGGKESLFALIYLGCANLVFMFHGFQFVGTLNNLGGLVLFIALIGTLACLCLWTREKRWMVSHWTYTLSSSSMITASTCLLFLGLGHLDGLSCAFLGSFLLTTQLLWICALWAKHESDVCF